MEKYLAAALPPLPAEPLVSVCIPAYNGGRWILETLYSALTQTYARIEVLVVDDRSTDDTVARVRALADPRVRVECNERNLGLVGNWNRCIRLARGELVKFLFQDDLLYPDCCRRMVELFRRHPTTGLVFSRRDVILENPDDARSVDFKRRFSVLDNRFDRIEEFNRGRMLFDDYLAKRFAGNFVGEPSVVMVRNAAFERIGYFNSRMYQGPDFEMWLRLMYYYDVGFIREPLCAFRFHAASMTGSNKHSGRAWLDGLWLIEGLLQHPEIRKTHRRIGGLRWREAYLTLRTEAWRVLHGMPTPFLQRLSALAAYFIFHCRRSLRSAPDVHREVS